MPTGKTQPIAILLIVTLAVSATTYYTASLTNPSTVKREKLVVSTTTSLFDTGLLDAVEKDFESKYPIDLYFISVGTGQAITQAQKGDADAVFVHAPKTEFKFMKDGYGVARKIVAYNFFVIVGPSDDPAGVKGRSVTEALKSIVEAGRRNQVIWVSRGDDSGTHLKEKDLWGYAGYNLSKLLKEPWYIEAGVGMGSTLKLTNEKSAYTLSDSATYLKYRTEDIVQLEALIVNGKELTNVYSVIAVNPEKIKGVNFKDAVKFIEYLVSDDTQRFIGDFGRDRFQKPLFSPASNLLKNNSDDVEARWVSELAFLDGSECPPQYRAGQDQLYR